MFSVMKALSTRNDEPERASRPYDGQRDGFVTAEGAGVLLLEERDSALSRDAHIYAELISFTSNSNGHHMTTLPEDGLPLQHLLRQALEEADITPGQLDYINSHGSSTLANERAETAAYKAVFGEQAYRIPISATKSMIGHSQGAASAIEAIVTALVLDRHLIPPTHQSRANRSNLRFRLCSKRSALCRCQCRIDSFQWLWWRQYSACACSQRLDGQVN